MPKRKLRIATCQFAETFHPRRNAAVMRRYLARAQAMRADVVHFHECALSGYCGELNSPGYDWSALREAAESLADEARRRRLWVLLPSAHRLTGPHKPHNSLYVINPRGEIVDRYDKRFLTPADLEYYTPGNRAVTFRIGEITCGLLICFDLRFPELYRELCRRGVTVLFQSFYNARFRGPGIHEHIMRQTVQAHAAMNGMWVSAPNSSTPYCRWGSVFVRPDGFIAGRLPKNRAGIMVNTVDPSRRLYDPVSIPRELVMKGVLHNGRLVRDVRSADRKHF
ncbi:MAG TPA: carbon-nitrogen hydrolase family protein [Phycisphaerae bacterium]|nr:carbon-nitrogen hydrolase family protein [Phycisphaerae bacterium]